LSDALGFLSAFVITVSLTPLLMRRAESWHLLDLPDTRKTHSGAVPLVGGLAMGVAFLASAILTRAPGGLAEFGAVVAAIVVAVAGGILDDRHQLRALFKFAFQIAAAVLFANWGGLLLAHLGNLMSEELFTLGRWGLPLTVFAIVGVMNSINMADGMDGLAGSLALVACFGFAFAAAAAGQGVVFTAICVTMGAIAGFLVYNARTPWRERAAVYMGETGCMLLGLLLAWFAIELAMGERRAPGIATQSALAPITAVWILAVPIADTVTLMLRRVLRGRSPFVADREHLHHILVALGLSSRGTVIAIIGLAAALAVAGIAAERFGVPQHVMFYAYMAGLIAWGLSAELLCRRLKLREN
jgi:UDP-GlcNAc:undecaprenyl-phosphate GlcNAc-1-phosphate transferase